MHVRKGDRLVVNGVYDGKGRYAYPDAMSHFGCNGEYMANYPLHDGRFHSGALGYTWQETYVNAKDEPRWTLTRPS